MAGISSVDCIGPAWSLMKKRLFQPFRFGYWSRIAVLGVMAGELSSGGNARGGGQHGAAWRTPGPDGFNPLPWIAQHWNAIMWGVAIAFAIGLLFFWIGSVLRFVLYEAVLRDKASIREGFGRWREQGTDYFAFRLMMLIPFLALFVYLVALPLLTVIKAGGGGPEVMGAVIQLGGAIALMILLGIMLAIVLVLTKDFVVPQMMYERVTCTEGWRRLLAQMRTEPGSFAGYILMKIVLAIGSFVVFAIALVLLAVVAAIPLAILVAACVGIFKVAGGGAAAIIALVVFATAIAIPVIMYCVGFVGAPISVFFPAYSIYFWASRYRPLYDEMYPQPAPGV